LLPLAMPLCRIQKTTHHATLCSLEILGRLLMKLNFEGSLAVSLVFDK
jgi:hypothetical protein